jgi:hypothetical protein
MRRIAWILAIAGLSSTLTARAQTAPPGEGRAEARERAALLAQVLPDAVRQRSFDLFPPVIIASGVLAGASGVAARWPTAIAAGGVMVAGGVGFYFTPESRNYELLAATANAGVGLYWLSLPVDEPYTRWQIPAAAGYLGMSALGFLSYAYSRHPGRTRLARDLARVRTPAARSTLTATELAEIERDLYDTDPFVPSWALGLPLVLGGAVSALPAFDGDLAPRDRRLIGLAGGAMVLAGLSFSLVETPASRYKDSLARSGLWAKVALTPGGVSLYGTFD